MSGETNGGTMDELARRAADGDRDALAELLRELQQRYPDLIAAG